VRYTINSILMPPCEDPVFSVIFSLTYDD